MEEYLTIPSCMLISVSKSKRFSELNYSPHKASFINCPHISAAVFLSALK